VLPLLRRTFGTFTAAERRGVGEQVRRGPSRASTGGGDGGELGDVDVDRGAAALPTVLRLLGVES
jgi:hypothetical protein